MLLAGHQTFPSITAFTDDFLSVLLVLALSAESELVLWLSIWDLVDTEPLVCGSEKTWEVAFNILDIVELGCKRIIDLSKRDLSGQPCALNVEMTYIDDNDLPVGLFLIQKSHDTENFDLLDLTSVANQFTDFANIERIVVTLGLGLGMNDIGVFPGLRSFGY